MPPNPTGEDFLRPAQRGTKDRLRSLAWRHPLLWLAYNLRHVLKASQMLFLDYRIEPQSRYGYGQPAHPGLLALLEQGRDAYRELLHGFLPLEEKLKNIPLHQTDDRWPFWLNGWMPPLDAVALYGLLAQRKPRLYLEVGSGHSTRFARRAIEDYSLPTRIVSLDPHPRAEIDALCDRLLRQPLQRTDLKLFDELQAGDCLFLDCSHVLLTNSDVAVAFLEILPRLPAGVLVQVHDIFLPYDYPPRWAHHYWSEQYLLAFALLEGASKLKVVLPNAFISADPELSQVLQPLWPRLGLPEQFDAGVSMWLMTQ
jgi:Methyltransferase domain